MTNNFKISSLVLTGIASLTIAIGIGRFSYTPILPYMLGELELTATEGGLIASSNFFGYLLGSLIPILPFFPKKIKKLFFISIIICILTIFSMGLVENLKYFIFFRFVQGVFSAFVLILGTSIILPHIQELGKIYLSTVHFSGVALGMVLSSIVVSYLGSLGVEWDYLWISVGILSVVLSIQIVLFTPDQKEYFQNNTNIKSSSRFGFTLISISYCLYGFGYVAFGTFISTMARTTSGLENTEPYIWFIVGMSGIPSVFFWNWFGHKIGNDLSLFLACSIMGIGVLFSVFNSNEFTFLFSASLFGLTFIPITAMSLLEGQKRFSGSFIVSTAILTFSFSIGQVIGPYLAGYITDFTGSFNVSMYVSGSALIMGSVLMIDPNRFLKN